MSATASDLRAQAVALLAQADALDARECTGLSAVWCPLHGDCACPARDDTLDDPDCPLHNPQSSHAETMKDPL